MKFLTSVASSFALLVASAASAADSAVKTISLEDLHIRVTDTAKAGEWYVKYLGATPTQSPHRVSFGRTLIIFGKGENPGPSTVIDHFGLSYPNLDAKMKELAAAGARILTPAKDTPGLFKLGFIEDPFRVKIELVEDPDLLGFHHVHLRVPDPEATLKWYQEVFGGERGKLKGRIDGLRYRTIPEGYGGVSRSAKSRGDIWLLAARGEKLEPTDERVIHDLAFQVEDIKQSVTGFKSKGAPVVKEPYVAKIEGQDTGVVFTRDPDGVLLELLQRQKQLPNY